MRLIDNKRNRCPRRAERERGRSAERRHYGTLGQKLGRQPAAARSDRQSNPNLFLAA